MATASDLIAEIDKQTKAMAARQLPDMQRLTSLMQQVRIDSVCEQTGATRLLWAIEHKSPVAKFILIGSPDVTKRGTGKFDIPPIDLAIQSGMNVLAESLVQRSAAMPAAVAQRKQAETAKRTGYEAELKAVSSALERKLTDPAYLAVIAELESSLGVTAKKVRGRTGHLSFPSTPVRALAKATAMDEDAWLAQQVREVLPRGVSLFAAIPPGEDAKIELCAAPTTSWCEAIAVSRLLADEAQLHKPHEKLEMADVLTDFAKDHPFALLASGRYGVLLHLDNQPANPAAMAKWALHASPELNDLADKRDGSAEAAVARDIAESGMVWLPWGVEL
jgi:hypothetical protein